MCQTTIQVFGIFRFGDRFLRRETLARSACPRDTTRAVPTARFVEAKMMNNHQCLKFYVLT